MKLFFKKNISLFILCLFTTFAQGDNTIQLRLAEMRTTVPLTYNQQVKNYIDIYLANPDSTARMLGVWKLYEPYIENVLKKENLPIELKYIPFALSAMSANYTNSMGAAGYWQLLFEDAKNKYKLKITSYIDERKDIYKSTEASVKYLKDLHSIYNDWQLNIASLANSPSMVSKAMVATGLKNFWDIYPALPFETRDAVPRFIAAVYIGNYFPQHNISVIEPIYDIDVDSVLIDQQISFYQISSIMNISIKHLEYLNPIYKRDEIPSSENEYWLRLPCGRKEDFNREKHRIYKVKNIKPDNFIPTITKTETKVEPQLVKVMYKTNAGENLLIISDYFDCPVNMARKWNGIRKGIYVPAGKILNFWVPAEKKSEYEQINFMTQKQKKNLIKKD